MTRLRAVLLVLLLVGGISAQHGFDLARYASVGGLRALVEAYASYEPLVYMGACVVGILLHLPGIVLIGAGGVLFEGLPAVVYGWVASVIGTTAMFLVVRYLLRDTVGRAATGRFARLRDLDERLERHGFSTVLVLRLVFFLAPPLTWALGASRVRLPAYLAGTALGVLPGTWATVFLAGSIASREPGAGLFGGRTAVAGLVVVGGLLLGAVGSWRLRGGGSGTRSA